MNLLKEKLIPMNRVPQILPKRLNGKKIHIATVYRWALRGVGGAKLESVKIGGTSYTSEEAIERFTQCRNQKQTIPVSMKIVQERQVKQAAEQAAEILRINPSQDHEKAS